ncbi:hypothetical protein CIB84_011135 [Bambusicola thoracicus]|uniref:Uncharacterized protein n=1 Tax=Bambusicola thoracicus TaxID=9083 RepID=A0A2P4SLY9_BAMTH|nr:hypothetical protein CIB84_011135 [Bambusicola thoracicus]
MLPPADPRASLHDSPVPNLAPRAH